MEEPPYQRTVMGGTFDRLHAGHELLLRTAAHMSKEVFVGIVSEELGEELFANKDLSSLIQSYEKRADAVQKFLKKYCDHPEVAPLYDPWGPAPTDPRADLIVVTNETIENGKKINNMRQDNGLNRLDIVVIPWVYTDDGKQISSTLLRKREKQETETT